MFSEYFRVDPLVDIELPSLDDALERLGFEEDLGDHPKAAIRDHLKTGHS